MHIPPSGFLRSPWWSQSSPFSRRLEALCCFVRPDLFSSPFPPLLPIVLLLFRWFPLAFQYSPDCFRRDLELVRQRRCLEYFGIFGMECPDAVNGIRREAFLWLPGNLALNALFCSCHDSRDLKSLSFAGPAIELFNTFFEASGR